MESNRFEKLLKNQINIQLAAQNRAVESSESKKWAKNFKMRTTTTTEKKNLNMCAGLARNFDEIKYFCSGGCLT